MKKLLSLLLSLGFIVTPQKMPKDPNNVDINENNNSYGDKNIDIKSNLNKLILDIPDRRVHDGLYKKLLHELDYEKRIVDNTKIITKLDKERLIIIIKQL